MRLSLCGVRVGIQQPYLFPYKGYFDLISSVDKFVIYDDAKWMKGSWINRNYFPDLFTFRIKKHSDYSSIRECFFYDIEEDKKLFSRKFPNIEKKYLNCLHQDLNIADNCGRSLRMICDSLGIMTPFYYSSDIKHGSFVDGIMDMVSFLGGDTYVNLPGGKSLYDQSQFGEIKLEFVETTTGPSILCQM